ENEAERRGEPADAPDVQGRQETLKARMDGDLVDGDPNSHADRAGEQTDPEGGGR
ncbi:MAG: hypothetical protein JWN68_975, partial [Nocardioides sp.]|nr:hypothetical protein [Nocardioides sp.]